MIAFWIAAAVLSALAGALVLQRAARLTKSPAGDPTADVYRRQLGEIDDLAERGLLGEDERRVARAEAARRLISAAGEAQPQTPKASAAASAWVFLGAVAAPLAALGVYLALGSPGLPDQPFAKRLAAWRNTQNPADLTPGQLAAVLQDAVDKRPNDAQGRLLLAQVEMAEGNGPAAAENLRMAARLAPGNAEVWGALGVVLVQQAQGQEPAEAVDAFHRAVALDPDATAARYHLARTKILAGDLTGGLADWRALSAKLGDPDAKQALDAQIAATQKAGRLAEPSQADVQAQAQAQAQVPDQAQTQGAQAQAGNGPGPSDSQVQSAARAQAGASAGDRRAFIQSMVDSLAAKLKADPQDWRSWSLLVRSYGVLGDKAKQDAAYTEAARRFKGDPEAIRALDDARSGKAR